MKSTLRSTSLEGPAKSPPFAWPTLSVREANTEAIWNLLRAMVFAILLTRASSDPVFNMLSDGGGSMGPGAIVNALAIAIAFVLLARRPLTAPLQVLGIWGPFLLIAFGAALYAPDFNEAARLALVLLSYWSFFIIPFFLLRSQDDVSTFIMVVFGSSLVPSLYALVDIGQGLSDMADFRLQSTFSHPNIYAFYLVLLLGLALYVRSSRIIRVAPRVRLLITLYIPYLVVLLMLTKTRSAWITCGLMFFVYALRIDRKFLAGLLLLPILVAANPSVLERMTEVTEATEVDSFKQLNDSTRLNSYVYRQALWESALPQIIEKPLFGYGLESFKPATPSFFALVDAQGIDAHNLYLQTAYEMGLMGVLALAWLLGAVARQILKGRPRDPPGVLILSCILLAYMLQCYSDNMHFYLSFNWYFWFIMGTICAWVRNEELESAAHPRAALEIASRDGSRPPAR
jgi:putative inorganic carbon (hco3(-)) transporter